MEMKFLKDYLREECSIPKSWVDFTMKYINSVVAAYHSGLSRDEVSGVANLLPLVNKIKELSEKLNHMNKEYGRASQTIHLLRAENALLREQLRMYDWEEQDTISARELLDQAIAKSKDLTEDNLEGFSVEYDQ
jgi:3-phosphoglycerate kinase